MSTVTEKRITTEKLTAEEFFDWVERPDNRGRRFELIAGEVIEMPPAGKYHGFVCGNVSRILGNFAIARKKGYVCTNNAAGTVAELKPKLQAIDIFSF